MESCCLIVQHKVGGKLLLRLNIAMRPIANKYREGKLKSTLNRESNSTWNCLGIQTRWTQLSDNCYSIIIIHLIVMHLTINKTLWFISKKYNKFINELGNYDCWLVIKFSWRSTCKHQQISNVCINDWWIFSK